MVKRSKYGQFVILRVSRRHTLSKTKLKSTKLSDTKLSNITLQKVMLMLMHSHIIRESLDAL